MFTVLICLIVVPLCCADNEYSLEAADCSHPKTIKTAAVSSLCHTDYDEKQVMPLKKCAVSRSATTI